MSTRPRQTEASGCNRRPYSTFLCHCSIYYVQALGSCHYLCPITFKMGPPPFISTLNPWREITGNESTRHRYICQNATYADSCSICSHYHIFAATAVVERVGLVFKRGLCERSYIGSMQIRLGNGAVTRCLSCCKDTVPFQILGGRRHMPLFLLGRSLG